MQGWKTDPEAPQATSELEARDTQAWQALTSMSEADWAGLGQKETQDRAQARAAVGEAAGFISDMHVTNEEVSSSRVAVMSKRPS